MYNPHDPIPQWTISTMQRVGSEQTLARAAIRYANLGIPVFPCVPGGKQPLTPNGFHDATSSSRMVRHWWERTPEANIGLPTGATSGVLVVDVDVHDGGSGFEAFERARARGLGQQWGWLVRTPSGGIHAYYPTADGQEQRSWQVPTAHIDFRGDGGYVIAPPSRIAVDGSPKTYGIIAVATHPAAPVDAAKLREFLEPPRKTPALPTPGLPSTGCHPDALARTVALAPAGGRNRTLFWASCRMAEENIDRQTIVGWLMPAAQHAGLPDREIETTIDSACRSASRPGLTNRPTVGRDPTPGTAAVGPARPGEAIQL